MANSTKTTTATIYTLELNEDEAQFLVDVMDFIGGNEKTTRRRFGREIQRALEAVDLKSPFPVSDVAGRPASRGITFE
jgi:hypothetical protein